MHQPGTADANVAFNEIFTANRQTLVNAAARIIGCTSHAEDVVHDAFLKLHTVGVTSSIRSQTKYLMQVVRNLAIDHYRRRALEQRHSAAEEEGLAAATPEAATPEAINLNHQTISVVSAALAELPERTRYAFEMHRLQGQTQCEIARSLGVSPTLVNFMIRDALIHCRKALASQDD